MASMKRDYYRYQSHNLEYYFMTILFKNYIVSCQINKESKIKMEYLCNQNN